MSDPTNAHTFEAAFERLALHPSTYAHASWLERLLGPGGSRPTSRWAQAYLDAALLAAARAMPAGPELHEHACARLATLPDSHHRALCTAIGLVSGRRRDPLLSGQPLVEAAARAIDACALDLNRVALVGSTPDQLQQLAERVGQSWLERLAAAQPAGLGRRWRLRLPRLPRDSVGLRDSRRPLPDGLALAERLALELRAPRAWGSLPCW